MSAAHRNIAVRCPACDRTVSRQSRLQVYCSTKCMRRANYARRAGSGLLLGQDTALVPNPLNPLTKTMFCNGQNRSRASPVTVRSTCLAAVVGNGRRRENSTARRSQKSDGVRSVGSLGTKRRRLKANHWRAVAHSPFWFETLICRVESLGAIRK